MLKLNLFLLNQKKYRFYMINRPVFLLAIALTFSSHADEQPDKLVSNEKMKDNATYFCKSELEGPTEKELKKCINKQISSWRKINILDGNHKLTGAMAMFEEIPLMKGFFRTVSLPYCNSIAKNKLNATPLLKCLDKEIRGLLKTWLYINRYDEDTVTSLAQDYLASKKSWDLVSKGIASNKKKLMSIGKKDENMRRDFFKEDE